MPLPSWNIRETERNDRHSHVTVFVGPDADHRASAGTLVFDHDEFEDFARLLAGDTNRVNIERASSGARARPTIDVVDLYPGWKSDPDDPVRAYLGPDAMHLLGTPIPDHDPFDGEIICMLPAKPLQRIDPIRIRVSDDQTVEGQIIEWTYYSIETDGSVCWRPKPEGV